MRLSNGVRLLVSGLLLSLLFSQVDWEPLLRATSAMAWWGIPLAILLHLVAYLFGALRWDSLLRSHGIGYRPRDLLRASLLGSFLNNVLPSTVGGDAYRVYAVYRDRHGLEGAAAPILTERVFGILGLAFIGTLAIGLTDLPRLQTGTLSAALLSVSSVLLLAILLLASERGYRLLRRTLQPLERFPLVAHLARVTDACRLHLRDPRLSLRVFLFSLLHQLLIISSYWVIGVSLGLEAPFSLYALAIPVTMVIASVPLSLGGLGVREMSVVALLTLLGVEASRAGALALAYVPTLYLSTLPGLFLWLSVRREKGPAGAPTA